MKRDSLEGSAHTPMYNPNILPFNKNNYLGESGKMGEMGPTGKPGVPGQDGKRGKKGDTGQGLPGETVRKKGGYLC